MTSHTPDRLMKKIWVSLLSDFRASYDSVDWLDKQRSCLIESVRDFRECEFPDKSCLPPHLFKAQYQLESLFKRYIFTDDLYTDSELHGKTMSSFLDFQKTIASPLTITDLNHRVLQGARTVCRQILGKYDRSIHEGFCQFGRRAAVDVPYARSYLYVKAERLNGSKDHIKWYKNYLQRDKMLAMVTKRVCKKRKIRLIGSLNLTCVPKSFKTKRGIMPNTVIGSFISYGLGRYIQERLASNGLNIRTLQKKHGIYAKVASKSRHLVTADLSKASDGPTIELVNRIIPRDWFNAAKCGRSKTVTVDGVESALMSFMGMGIGFTFTLETLIFYALLKSIARLVGNSGLISVYGDDLIYPRELHKYVKVIFPSLRIQLNLDKTFVESHFRESCGSDYYHGVDVRPFQPEHIAGALKRQDYTAFCYKMYNGLLKRWEPEEIPQALLLLRREIALSSGILFRVPNDYPDESGIKTDSPYAPVPWYEPWDKLQWHEGYQCLKFRYLRKRHPRHQLEAGVMDVYYWEWHRSKFRNEPEGEFEDYADANEVSFDLHAKAGSITFVTDKSRSNMLVQTGTASNWTWVPRD